MDDPVTTRILAFLAEIGIPVQADMVPDGSLLPAMTVRDGAVLFDPARLLWPGDLLHEAGHIAVTDPALRGTLKDIPSNPAEEMAAMAWSYAAVLAIGLPPAIVFHDQGYRGEGRAILDAFEAGAIIGQPMLQWYGMTLDAAAAASQGIAPFPHMLRWLR